MPIKINGATSGSTTITAPDTGGDETIVLSTALAGKADIVTNGAWTSYTPTTTRLTVGNGTLRGHYIQVGKLVTVRIYFEMGSTSSVLAGGGVAFSYPVTAKSGLADHLLGTAYFENAGIAGYNGFVRYGATSVQPSPINGASGQVDFMTVNYPFTWGIGDYVMLHFSYEAA